MQDARPLRLFVAHAEADHQAIAPLVQHLSSFVAQRLLTITLQRELPLGKERSGALQQAVAEADVVLLMISPDFPGADPHHWQAVHESLRRHEGDGLVTVPVRVRSVFFSRADRVPWEPLIDLPRDRDYIYAQGAAHDEAWTDVVKAIDQIVVDLRAGRRPQLIAQDLHGDEVRARLFGYGFTLPGRQDLACDRYDQWKKIQPLATDREDRVILVPGPLHHGHSYFLLRLETGLDRDPPRDVLALRSLQRTKAGWLGQMGEALGVGGAPAAVQRALSQRLRRKNIILLHPLLDRCGSDEVLDQSPLLTWLTEGLPELLEGVERDRASGFGVKVVQPLAWVERSSLLRLRARLWRLVSARKEPVWLGEALSRPRMLRLIALLQDRGGSRVTRLADLSTIHEDHVRDFCKRIHIHGPRQERFVQDVFFGQRHPDDVLRSIVAYLPKYKSDDKDAA